MEGDVNGALSNGFVDGPSVVMTSLVVGGRELRLVVVVVVVVVVVGACYPVPRRHNSVLVFEDGNQICGCRLCVCGSVLSRWRGGSRTDWLLLAVDYGRWMFLAAAHSC
ncbi:hypothetical protein SLEP1_g11578 [Rubroshorea leprosula]|nr:hypothetical protein SLEP1_g11578 [Rubroshorea leprosula]